MSLDINEYIASGVLEAYALDLLSPEEKAEVEGELVKYSNLREELRLIEEGLEAVALQTGIEAPVDLKDQIFSQLDNEPSVEESFSLSKESSPTETKVVPLNRTNSTNIWRYTAAAAITLTLVSSYLAYDYRTKWNNSQIAYNELQGQNQLIADQYNQVNNKLDQLVADVDVISNADFAKINMGAINEGESLSASIYWNAKTQEAYLNIESLKTLSEDQQYQLWAIVDGKPVDMGVFDFDQEGLLKMKSVANASMFAVTIEPKGGSVDPTLEAMQVAGEVG